MDRPLRTLFLLASLALPLPAHAAVVVVNDTFGPDGATRFDDPTDPDDLAFYAFSGGDTLSVSDGRLKVRPAGPYARYGSAAFSPVSLASVGDTVTFSFDVVGTRAGVLPSDVPSLKIGLYDSTGTPATDDSPASGDAAANDRGMLLSLLDDPGQFYSGVFQWDQSGHTLQGEVGAYIGSLRFLTGQTHTFAVQLEKTGVGTFYRLFRDGQLVSSNELWQPAPFHFDNIQFGIGNVAYPVDLDNVRVTYAPIPEPAALALAPLTALAARRRRPINR